VQGFFWHIEAQASQLVCASQLEAGIEHSAPVNQGGRASEAHLLTTAAPARFMVKAFRMSLGGITRAGGCLFVD
jgi:hypothetical protein